MMEKNLPNIIIVMPDELRSQAVGLTKTDPVISPNIDAFAKESVTLVNTLSNCPICSPARAMLFSGKYPISNGVIDNCYSKTIEFGVELKEEEVCLSDILSKSGYSLGYIGKYHLDLPKEEHAEFTEGWRGDPQNGGTLWDAYTPPGKRRHGFDFWYSYGCCDEHFSPHYWKNEAEVNQRIDVQQWSVDHETDVAIDYIKNIDGSYRDSNNPFFLCVSHNPPHMPFELVPDKYKELYKDIPREELLNRPNVDQDTINDDTARNYFSAITGIDENFGRLLDVLDDQGLEENTIVIFMSDHGEMLGSHGRMGKNSWYNESLLIPFIIRWKSKLIPKQDNWILNMPDIMPTILGLIGLENKIPVDIEGIDKSSFLVGEKEPGTNSGFYISSQPFFPEARKGVRTNEYTFVVIKEKLTGKLSYVVHDHTNDNYQLEDDINSKNIKSKLSIQLVEWLSVTNDPWLEDKEVMAYLKGFKSQNLKIGFKSTVSRMKSIFR